MNKQLEIVNQWVAAIRTLPGVRAAWLEGSLARGDAHSGSDIDARILLTEESYRALWIEDREKLLRGIGRHVVVVNADFIRALTYDGIVFELTALRDLSFWRPEDFKLLFGETPTRDIDLERRTPVERWPSMPHTSDELNQLTYELAVVMAGAASPVLIGDIESAMFQLDLSRIDLLKIMWRVKGLRYAVKYKHMREVFSETELSEIRATYPLYFSKNDVGAAMLNLYDTIGNYLRELSERSGGGFDTELWRGGYAALRDRLKH